IVASAGALDEDGRSRIGRASLAGFALAIIVVTIELLGDFPIRRALSGGIDRPIVLPVLDRGAIVLSLACWPAIIDQLDRRRPLVALLVFVATLLALTQFFSITAIIGFIAASPILSPAWWRPRLAALLLIAGVVGLTLALPFRAPPR